MLADENVINDALDISNKYQKIWKGVEIDEK